MTRRPLKLINHTEYSNWFLRRMMKFCAESAGVPFVKIRHAHFGNRAWRDSCGWCIPPLGQIKVMLTKNAKCYPRRGNSYVRKNSPPQHLLEDKLEVLISITAHEIRHLLHRPGILARESQTMWAAFNAVMEFRERREELLHEWQHGKNAAAKAQICWPQLVSFEALGRNSF